MFKAVFTKDTAESRGALSDLISALIGRTVTVEIIVANEPAVEYLGGKKIRYDIACKSKDGEPINVEMSFHPLNDELNRLEYYASKLLIGQDIGGVEKSYCDLKEAYRTSILAQLIGLSFMRLSRAKLPRCLISKCYRNDLVFSHLREYNIYYVSSSIYKPGNFIGYDLLGVIPQLRFSDQDGGAWGAGGDDYYGDNMPDQDIQQRGLRFQNAGLS